MLKRLLVGAAGLAALSGSLLMGLGSAGAATVNGPAFTDLNVGPALAGYEVNGNGTKAYNDVRGTVFIPAGSKSNPAVFLQTNTVSGGHTSELALVLNGAANLSGPVTCAADQWTLAEGWGVPVKPGPLALVQLHQAPGNTCVNAGSSYYLEVHYSTLLREIAYVAGPNEFTNTNTLNTAFIGFQQFFAPAVGVHYVGALPTVNTPQASFTRDGLTSLNNSHARRGGTNSRLNLASQNTLEVEAIVSADGPPDAPTVSDPVFLNTSAFGSGGSFSVTASS